MGSICSGILIVIWYILMWLVDFYETVYKLVGCYFQQFCRSLDLIICQVSGIRWSWSQILEDTRKKKLDIHEPELQVSLWVEFEFRLLLLDDQKLWLRSLHTFLLISSGVFAQINTTIVIWPFLLCCFMAESVISYKRP